jgi:two-component system response regulator YesN
MIVSSYWETSQQKIMSRAREYIQANFEKDISLEEVAMPVYLSPVYFSRLFKRCTGENFSDYLVKSRMKKAVELMQQPEYKVYEISQMVGYKNSRYFAKIFKRFTELTPSDYRKKLFKESGYKHEK